MKTIKGKKNIHQAPINQLDVLDNRHNLREYCAQNNIKTPDFFASDQFSKISLWAMQKNTFPLCIKSSKNLSNNQCIFILKAFRELPEFFEKIQEKTNNDKVLIEEFIEAKAYLEVTTINSQIKLISQISITKSMKVQQKWRAFPLKLPISIFEKIKTTIESFNQLTNSTDAPIRFSFAVKNSEPILISINSDYNRIEYKEDWLKQAELKSLQEITYPPETNTINKLAIYKCPKDKSFDFSTTSGICKNTKYKYELIDNKLYILLSAKDQKELTEDFDKINALIKQIINNE